MASTSFARLGDELWKAADSPEEIAIRMESFEHIYNRLQGSVEHAAKDGHFGESYDADLAALCTIRTLRFLENKKLNEQSARIHSLACEAKHAAAAANAATTAQG